MAIEATDVDQPFQEVVDAQDAQDAPDAPAPAPEEPQDAPPRARGRPAGAKDKQPRKRPHRAAEPEELPRPVTRRSAPPKQRARRVRIVESASEASSSAEEEPLTPGTARHRQWAEYRQQKSDAHQASVNRYVALFDRMLA